MWEEAKAVKDLHSVLYIKIWSSVNWHHFAIFNFLDIIICTTNVS